FFYRSAALRCLHCSPTRRSSDLGRSPRVVLESDSPLEQLVADLVGTPEIFRPARFVAFGDQRSNLRFGNLVSRAGAQKILAFPGQQPEYPAECSQLACERR